MKMSTKKGVFPESLAISFSCPYFPHHREETQTLQPLHSNMVLQDRGEKKVERPEQGISTFVNNQVETVAKRSINLLKFKPEAAE